ncbi:putative metal-dependent hydrolase [Actinomadura rubteroloni]|uniref:Putative metal-dependent hydrolase n=1 Tax=Actinomadura rubteroloni TaxID=1926885 RepID=A0A2P4UHU2_9ACTN|nr:metal-dependent hydrolase [Actinomadura rubteroloni]POM24586.1 putative metal-dependent hydrolase [Actinomadura rubteroloni]
MTVRPDEPEGIVLQARDVRFDWTGVPLHWIPRDPVASHLINVLHLLLPAGEEWFIRVFKQALPYIRDDRLREDVLGFIGQEAVHATSHEGVLEHFGAQGLDVGPFVRQVDFMFEGLLGDRDLTGEPLRAWLFERVAIIAAIEHFTGVLGDWVLNASALDRAGADPTMLDLLRWHGAEEVEHRHVAHDLFMHLDGSYAARLRAMSETLFMLGSLWQRGHRYLLAADPVVRGRVRGGLGHLRRTGPAGLSPSRRALFASIRRYLRRDYTPLNEGSTVQALAYLASSPAAQAALR